MVTVEELTKMSNSIEGLKKKKAQQEGRLQALMDRLSKEFKCSSIKQAKTKLGKLGKEIESAKEELRTSLQSFKKRYPV